MGLCAGSCWGWLSSAKRKSRAVSSCTLVLTCSLRGLKSFLSVGYRKPTPMSPSQRASVSMAENIMLNRVGASTQPCLTPLVTGNGWEYSPLSSTLAFVPSWNCRTIVMNLGGGGHPKLAMIFHSPSWQTMSNTLVRSMKVVNGSTFCS